jgi:hypothetical protein
MKNRILLYTAIFSLLTFLNACMEEDEKYATKVASDGNIIISIPEKALPAPPVNQAQLAQPDFNVISGRFAITDDVSLNVTLSEGLTNLTINTLVTTSGVRHEKASLSGVDGTVEWTFPVNQLGLNNAAPSVGTAVTLELVASNDDGSRTVTRMFTVNVLDPLTLAATNPTTSYADSTITLSYTIPAATSLAIVSKVDLLVKRGVKGTETLVATNTHGDVTTKTDKFTFVMPSENPSGALDTMFFRVRATYETGRTATKSTTVRFVNVPMATTNTGLTLYNPAVTGADTARTGYDFGKLRYVTPYEQDSIRDIKLVVSGLNIGFTSGTDNNSQFVKVATADYAPATYQSLRKLFTAPAAVPVTSVANVFVGDVYVVKIRGGKRASTYGIFRVTAVTLTPDGNARDFITFDFKSK